MLQNVIHMKGILTTLLLVCAFGLRGQPCEYDRKEIDEFTGSDVTITKFTELYSDDFKLIKVQLMRVDSFYSIVIGMNIGKIYAIDEGAQLMFIMEDSSVFATPSLKHTVATGRESIIGTIWYGTTAFYLDSERLKMIATYGIKKLRIYTTDGYLEVTISPEAQNIIKDLAACL